MLTRTGQDGFPAWGLQPPPQIGTDPANLLSLVWSTCWSLSPWLHYHPSYISPPGIVTPRYCIFGYSSIRKGNEVCQAWQVLDGPTLGIMASLPEAPKATCLINSSEVVPGKDLRHAFYPFEKIKALVSFSLLFNSIQQILTERLLCPRYVFCSLSHSMEFFRDF